jgi:hypothetical protein
LIGLAVGHLAGLEDIPEALRLPRIFFGKFAEINRVTKA